ncbi:MAG TPA: hypothetical protein VNN73_07865 [Blastocatellia bacterium]|nr:hypothetical protein [Blastocatellia bacterium]
MSLQLLKHGALALFIMMVALAQSSSAQQNLSDIARLVRLEGSFGTEIPAKADLPAEPIEPLIALGAVRIEADSMGFHTRLWPSVEIVNKDAARTITEVLLRLDIYDEELRVLSRSIPLSEKVKAEPKASASMSVRFAAILPDRMLILIQIASIKFADGSAWRPPVECSLAEDFKSLTCKSISISNRPGH